MPRFYRFTSIQTITPALAADGAKREVASILEVFGWDTEDVSDSCLMLDWKPPTVGGTVSAYKVQFRTGDSRKWADVGMSAETEIILSDQQRGVELMYHVLAINKTGEGKPSNTVSVVL
jgi:hypothetical protein